MTINNHSSELSQKQTKRMQWPIAFVLIVFMLVSGFLLYQCTPRGLLDAGTDTGDKAVKAVTKVLDAFKKDNITTTFSDRLTEISNSKGGLLEVAVIKSVEGFKRSTTNWRGTTISEIRVPAIFKYDVSLKDKWVIETRESEHTNICIILAPMLRPSVPVPIQTHRIERYSEEGWLRWDGEEEMDALLAQITPELNRRARFKKKFARDKARLAIAEFTKTWLLEADHWRSDRFSVIQVVFNDELEDNDDLDTIEFRPTLSLTENSRSD